MEKATSILIATTTASAPFIKEKVSFFWYDYVLFAIMLGFSAAIGVYFGCFGSKQSTTGEYLLGGKTMKVVPIVISLVASHISGITLLAVPADIYTYGALYWLVAFSMIIVVLVTAYIYLPVFFNLQITSTYEYLEMRFDNRVRTLASFLFALSNFLFLPIVIYVPALACSAATGINVHYIAPVICGVCIFYTTIGGLKAVVWTDTLQFTITVGAILTVLILGAAETGGFVYVWNKAVEGHRLDLFDFDLDPTKRDSFWIITVGFTVHWISITSMNQGCVQKFIAVATLKEAKMCVWLYGLGIAILKTMSVFAGLLMYAKYVDCDPFTTGQVSKSDQLLPFYVMEVAVKIPGLSGLFIAGVVSAALSTLSAHLNCLAATIYEDFIAKVLPKGVSEKTASNILKLIVLVAGITCTVFIFVIEHLGGILPLAVAFSSVTAGPVVGMFTLGILVPRCNAKSALWGGIVGLVSIGIVIFTAQYYKAVGAIYYEPKPVSTEGCPSYLNISTPLPHAPREHSEAPFVLFRVSHYYYTALGTVFTLIAAFIVSLFTTEDNPVRPELVSSLVHRFIPKQKNNALDGVEYKAVEKVITILPSKNGE